MFVSSFPPIIGDSPSVLILGSMPGGESLRRGEYYAHPRNLFWLIMEILCGAGPDLPYATRAERLVEAGVALWDVLKHCEREGSLDSNIRVQTEIPNELASFLQDHESIVLTAFNGQKAAGTFERRVAPALAVDVRERVQFVRLPSTSPANASKNWVQKLEVWRSVLAPYLNERRTLGLDKNEI